MNDSILFNWPSGASGDFILTVMELVKQSDATPEYIPTVNRFHAGQDNRTNVFRSFSSGAVPDYNNMKYDYLIHRHSIEGHVPSNIKIINIDNSDFIMHSSMLYYIKTLDEFNQNDSLLFYETSDYVMSKYGNRPKFVNIAYHDLFIRPDNDTIKLLYKEFGVDIDNVEDMVYNCFRLYSKLNRMLLKSITVSYIKNKPKFDKKKIALTTLEQLQLELEKAKDEISKRMERVSTA